MSLEIHNRDQVLRDLAYTLHCMASGYYGEAKSEVGALTRKLLDARDDSDMNAWCAHLATMTDDALKLLLGGTEQSRREASQKLWECFERALMDWPPDSW